MRVTGRARSWSEKVRRNNLWTAKGYDLVKKHCRCRCGKGLLRRDMSWPDRQTEPDDGGPAVSPPRGPPEATPPQRDRALFVHGTTPSPSTSSGMAWATAEDQPRWFPADLSAGGGTPRASGAAADAAASISSSSVWPRSPGVIGRPPDGGGASAIAAETTRWSAGGGTSWAPPQGSEGPSSVVSPVSSSSRTARQPLGIGGGGGSSPHNHPGLGLDPIAKPHGQRHARWSDPLQAGAPAVPPADPWLTGSGGDSVGPAGGGGGGDGGHAAIAAVSLSPGGGWTSSVGRRPSWGPDTTAERRDKRWPESGAATAEMNRRSSWSPANPTEDPWPSALGCGIGRGPNPGTAVAKDPPGLSPIPARGGLAGTARQSQPLPSRDADTWDTWPLSLLRADEAAWQRGNAA